MNYSYNPNSNSANNMSNTSMDENHSDDFSRNPKLKNIDPTKLRIITKIKEQSKNKSIEELLPEIMRINQELNRRNMNFTKEETALLLDAIEESLSPVDRKKFNMIKSFM